MIASMQKSEGLILGRLLEKLSKKMGAKVLIEPEWGVVGQITFKSGKRSYFRYNTLDLNPVGASDIAKDKDYASFFLKKLGFPSVAGKTFFRDDWAAIIGSKRDMRAAYTYAAKLGFPVIVKPNSGSQGSGVALVHNKRELFQALRTVFKNDRVALVQRRVSGRDYRIVVLDDQVISAYERIPLSVIGDGRSTIAQLLKKKAREFVASSRDTQLDLKDPRIALKLRRQGRALASIPEQGERVFLLDNANLSTGGDALDVTDVAHPSFKKIAISLTKEMGLRICGVDLMIEGDIAQKPGKYHVLEINAAPGLDHYVKGGKAQQKIVEDLYLQVLKSLAK